MVSTLPRPAWMVVFGFGHLFVVLKDYFPFNSGASVAAAR
jgi:hypothetical protein